MRVQLQQKFQQLRLQFPVFTYQNYRILPEQTGIRLIFNFDLANQYQFQPEIFIPGRSFYHAGEDSGLLQNLAFHIGMVELISYWKLSCAPLLKILPHQLTQDQIQWWRRLYFNGLGEFFFVNGIVTSIDDFMEIESLGKALPQADVYDGNGQTIVPVGGGKDSVVSLELLMQDGKAIRPMIINPREASTQSARIAGFEPEATIVVQRSLDPLLLKLNNEGFLNGHTPFSALLAFVAAFTAVRGGFSNIALSNESSANEATVLGTEINHQYSKSLDFERDFRHYLGAYIAPGLNYFSLLRPLNELQIASIFSKLTAYHKVFKSCNVGSKTDSWCCNCPKCLFTWVMLSPFIDDTNLMKIFGENLAEKPSLSSMLASLKGESTSKPFECVGTVEEVNAAVMLQASKANSGSLYQSWKNNNLDIDATQNDFEKLLHQFDTNHCLSADFESIVKKAVE